MAKTFRVTLWSGGKPAVVYYVKQAPALEGGLCSFTTEDGTAVRLMGSVSIEEGEFSERISSMRVHQPSTGSRI